MSLYCAVFDDASCQGMSNQTMRVATIKQLSVDLAIISVVERSNRENRNACRLAEQTNSKLCLFSIRYRLTQQDCIESFCI